MRDVVNAWVVFFGYAVLAVFAQNAIFTRALGVSRLVQLVGDDRTSSWLFGLQLCITQVLVAPLTWYAGSWIVSLENRAQLRPHLLLQRGERRLVPDRSAVVGHQLVDRAGDAVLEHVGRVAVRAPAEHQPGRAAHPALDGLHRGRDGEQRHSGRPGHNRSRSGAGVPDVAIVARARGLDL